MTDLFSLSPDEAITVAAKAINDNDAVDLVALSGVYIGRDNDKGLRSLLFKTGRDESFPLPQDGELADTVLTWQSAFRAFYPVELREPKRIAIPPHIGITEGREPTTVLEGIQALCSDIFTDKRLPTPTETQRAYAVAFDVAEKLEGWGFKSFAEATRRYITQHGFVVADRPTPAQPQQARDYRVA